MVIKYRNATIQDYEQIAKVHKIAFKSFFLTSLGENFLKTYYRSCIKDKRTIAICALDGNNNIVGFVSGTDFAKGYHKKLFFNNFFSFCLSLFWAVIKKPKVLKRLVKNIEKKSDFQDTKLYAELLSIAVLPGFSGFSIGKSLLANFEAESIKRNVESIVLTTDFLNNEAVLAFYLKAGYSEYYIFDTYPNRKMYKLIKHLK